MLVIARPAWSLIRVVWYSNGPGKASNFQSKSEPQNWRPLSVSSAGISKCTGWPGMATPLASVGRRRPWLPLRSFNIDPIAPSVGVIGAAPILAPISGLVEPWEATEPPAGADQR